MFEKNKINAPSSESGSDEVDLRKIIGNILDNVWLIIGVTAIFTVMGVVYSLFSTPIYKADALIQVEKNAGASLINNISQMLPSGQPASDTEIELIKSRMVLGKTIEDLALNDVIEEKRLPVFGKGWSRIIGKKESRISLSRLKVDPSFLDKQFELIVGDDKNYELKYDGDLILKGKVGTYVEGNGVALLVNDIDAANGTVFTVEKRSELTSINHIINNFSVADKGKDTGVLSLSLSGENPEKIRTILDSISKNYLLQNVERKSEEAAKSLSFLKEQLPTVRRSLDDAENKLNNYRQANDSVDLSLEAKSVLDNMVSLETQLNEITFKEAEISKLYTKEHPAYRTLLEKRTTLENERDRLNKKVSQMPKTQQEVLRLTRDVQAGQEVYMQLLNKQQELSINKASTVGNVRIIDNAIVQLKPIKPQKTIAVLASFILGIIVSIVFVIIKSVIYRGVENPEQLEAMGINVYASIPLSVWQQSKDREFKLDLGKKSNARADKLLATGNAADLAIEAIRGLRTSLHFAMLEAKNNIVMISGASPSIGKTFICTNLAAVIAQSGKKVLLIDADMRKGYTHVKMGASWENGLSDLLSSSIETHQCIRKTEIEGLDFVPRGTVPPNPSELLMSQRFDAFLEWASNHYDLVLIDTPPILAVTDPAIVGRMVGTTLLVAKFITTTPKEIEVSIRRFNQNGVAIKGVILNAVIKKASSYYMYGYSNYQYEYGQEKSHKSNT